eukprot:4465611-Amphidinium_carterae.2
MAASWSRPDSKPVSPFSRSRLCAASTAKQGNQMTCTLRASQLNVCYIGLPRLRDFHCPLVLTSRSFCRHSCSPALGESDNFAIPKHVVKPMMSQLSKVSQATCDA